MVDACEQTAEFRLIEAVAEALREELSASMEEQRGGARDEATARRVNWAFRVAARCILRRVMDRQDNLVDQLNWALVRLARRRLVADGLDRREFEHVIVHESGGRGDWLAFLVLTPLEEIKELLRTRGLGPELS